MVSFLDFFAMLSGTFVRRGRPLLRFGDTGGVPSSPGDMGCVEGATMLSDSGNTDGVLGGRPLFLFNGATGEFTLESVEVELVDFPGGVSVFLDWLPPLPRPKYCCCSPICAAIRDSVSNRRRTGRFLNTGMSGERWGGEYGG